MSEWDNFPVAKGDSWEDYPEAPQPSFTDNLKGAVRKGVEFLAPNIAAQHPMGTPGDLSGTITAGVLRDIKTAPQSAAQLALGAPGPQEAEAAAGNIWRVAPPLTSAGMASRLGMGAARGLSPPASGMVRFFHGGEAPTSGGSRWLTPDQNYATNFRASGTPNQVHYVDLPKGH